MSNEMSEYRTYSEADKAALHELRKEILKKNGMAPTTGDLIAAITPSLPTPAHLRGI